MVDKGVLTTEEIARLAGVTRGTVSGWRRRYADFPAPVSGTVFSRAEIETWLAGAGRWELTPHARLWREVSHAARGSSLGEVVAAVARQAPEPAVPATLAWVAERAVGEAGAAAVLGELTDRYSAASGHYVVPARIAEFMVSLAGIGEDATVLDPASGTGGLLAAALAQGAGRVLAQEASAEAAALARARLRPGEGQHAEVAVGEPLSADAFAGVEADAVLLADRSDLELGWARYALAHLKPGGLAVLLLPSSAATSPAGAQLRADLLRDGSLRALIQLPPSADWLEPHVWLLRRPDGKGEPDLRALFVEPRPDLRAAPDVAVEAMSAAQWLAFTSTTASTWERLNGPGMRTISSGGGRNAHFCVTWVADLLDDSLLGDAERLGATFGISPGRMRAHFSAVCRVRDGKRAASTPASRNPARSFMHARMALSLIPLDVDGIAETLKHFDWLDARDIRKAEARRPPAVWPPKAALPADPWRTATIPELARLSMLRYRPAGSKPAEILRAGDVLVPLTGDATVVGTEHFQDKAQEGDPAGPRVHLIRPDAARLDPWFLVGFLTGCADIGELEVPLLPFEDQERYAAAFRRLRYLKTASANLADKVAGMASNVAAGLTAGEISLEAETG